MKKENIIILKAAIAIFVVLTVLFTTIPVTASEQNSFSNKTILCNTTGLQYNEVENNESLLVFPGSSLIYVKPPIMARLTGVPYRLIRNWQNKQFNNTTIMFFGSLSSIRPRMGIHFYIISYSDNPPKKVEVICENKTYATLKGFSIPGNPITLYPFYYAKKGFHHVKFIPDGNESACVNIDFQLGFMGFRKNILPHLFP